MDTKGNEQDDQHKVEPATSPKHTLSVETYAGDMADVLGNDAGGLVRKVIHEEEERDLEKRNLSPQAKKNKVFLFVGILLILLALGILSFFVSKKSANTIAIQPQFIPLIFTDQSTSIEISGFTKDAIAQAVLSEVQTPKVAMGQVEGIYLTENKQGVGLRRFISLIQGNFVPGNDTSVISDNFLMGMVDSATTTTNTTSATTSASNPTGFFILLKMRSTTDIFDPMRAWEADMLTDLHGFFNIPVNNDTNYLFSQSFTDGIVQNKNARILYDKNGNIVLMYVFADNNSVVITDSQAAAEEVMLRLANQT